MGRFANDRQRRHLYVIQEGVCAICKEALPDHFEVDHIVPESCGGVTELWNLQGVCLLCHQEKTKVDGSHQRT